MTILSAGVSAPSISAASANEATGGLYVGGVAGADADGLGGCGLIGGETGSGGGVVQDAKIAAASGKLKILAIFLNMLSPYYFHYIINRACP
jgi:hypothetical protein